MDRILVATPLPHNSVRRSFAFLDNVTIQKLEPILWDLSVVKTLISEKERKELSESRYWMSVSKEVESWPLEHSDNDLYEKVRRAMYALQIIRPSAGRNVYLKFRETPEGFDNIGSQHPSRMNSTLMGRLAVLEEDRLQADFDRVYQGVTRAFDEKIVRLQNPILLLEHGLQIGHVYLSTLMWVMGLDMLLMAGGNKSEFVNRAAGLLGATTQVFPAVSAPYRQPQLTVGEVLGDVYELRNLVAHGLEIPAEPFREKRDIVDTDGTRININDYSYAGVLMEAALFVLVRSLQNIMLDGHVDVVKDEAEWKQKLKVDARLERLGGHPKAANEGHLKTGQRN